MIPQQLVRSLAVASKKFKPKDLPDDLVVSRPSVHHLKRKDDEIERLQADIKHLEMQLSVSASPVLQQKIERLLFLVGDLSARAEHPETIHHAKRHKELEHKIRKKKTESEKGLIKLKKSLAILEKKYKALQKKGFTSEQLAPIHERMEQVKRKLGRKVPTDRADMAALNPFPKPALPVKHHMVYPIETQDEPRFERHFEEEQPMGVLELSTSPPPQRKKHGFLRNLF